MTDTAPNPNERHFLETLACGHKIEVITFVGQLPAQAQEEFAWAPALCFDCPPDEKLQTVAEWRELEADEWDGEWETAP